MREQLTEVVERYIDAVRRNDPASLPLHADVICEFPLNTYRGAAAFAKGLDDFSRVVKRIDVLRLLIDGEHCVALLDIDTVFGLIPFAEHLHVVNGEIVSIRAYCDPRPIADAGKPSRQSSVERFADAQLWKFAVEYTAAWCSQNPPRVAACYAPEGSLQINDGVPSVGRAAIAEVAHGFMAAFPDLVVAMDQVSFEGEGAAYGWTLTGTHVGPGGTGNAVRISGREQWTFGEDGLIRESKGYFDEAEYQRQLQSIAPRASSSL
jgi:nuclear transport factor 2 (NTF2) superfamily protein